MKKRMLTMLLALVMIMSVLPFTAMAAETPCDHVGHGYYLEKAESTCKLEGAVHFFCKKCGEKYYSQPLPVAAHTYGKDGKCTVCGIACEHSLGSAVTVAATCTAAGGKTQTCTKCGYIKVLKTTEPKGHNFTIDVIGLAASCTIDGYTTHKTCSVCGEKNEDYAVIESTGHVLKIIQDVAAACKKDGVLKQECTVEDCEYEVTTVREQPGHSYIDVAAKDPTCTEDGHSAYKKCSVCGIKKNNTYSAVAATGHTYVNGQCRDCGDAAPGYSGTPAPGTPDDCDHKPSLYITSADCENVGYKVETCDACHVELSREIISATGHDPKTVTKNPTCTENGYEREICKDCNKMISNTTYAKYGHNYVNGICTRCGGSDSSKYTNDFQEVQIVGGTAY